MSLVLWHSEGFNGTNHSVCWDINHFGIWSHLLKLIKFFVMIEHIEQNIFVNKLFLLLNISDFSLISIKKLHPLKKVTPLFSSKPPLENWDPVKPLPVLKMWLEAHPPLPPPAESGGCQKTGPKDGPSKDQGVKVHAIISTLTYFFYILLNT